MPSNHLILCHPLLPLPSIFPSIEVFPNESVLRIRWPNYWSFGFNISPSSENSRLISFRTDWFDLLAVQGTLKSLIQHQSSNASNLWHSAFFCGPTLISVLEMGTPASGVERAPYDQWKGIWRLEASVQFSSVQFSHSVVSDSLRSQCKQILLFLLFTTPSLNLFRFFTHEIPKAYISFSQFLINLLLLCLKKIIAACFGHFLGPILMRPPCAGIQICFFFSC